MPATKFKQQIMTRPGGFFYACNMAHSSRPGDLVADFFAGSGSTIKAALSLGRRALGVELDRDWYERVRAETNNINPPCEVRDETNAVEK